MSLIRSVVGIINVEVTSADIPAVVDLLCKNGIILWDVSCRDDLTVRFCIQRTSYRKLHALLEKRGDSCRLVSQTGLYWSFHALTKRPVLIIGIAFFLFLLLFIPSRIFFVEVEGNSSVCSKQILSVASNLGVRFGASRRLVKSEQIKNGLLSAIEQLEWVGVNTKGCVAIISVREYPLEESTSRPQGFGDMIAIRDGVVLNCDVVRGSAQCLPGHAVRAGDILISGTLNQGGALVSSLADGEVFASTERLFSSFTTGTIQKRGMVKGRNEKFALQIGKKQINFFKCSGISGGTCVKMYSKYVLTLPGGFPLPVTLVKYSFVSCDLTEETIEQSQAFELLSDFSEQYIRDQMIAGRILTSNEEIHLLGDGYQMTGTYACTEMIGRVQQEQIGAYNGKTD